MKKKPKQPLLARASTQTHTAATDLVFNPGRLVCSLWLAGLLAGCAVGPDFKRPDPPATSRYTPQAEPATTTAAATALGNAQTLQTGGKVDVQWWRSMGASRLDALIERAFRNNPSLASAKATLRQAQELHTAQAGSTFFPQIDANLGAQRQRMSPSGLGQAGEPREYILYNASVGVHYRLDLAGGNRRALEALAARVDYRSHELAGARLTLAANITTTAIARARLAGQIEATQAVIAAQDEQIKVVRDRLRLGNASATDLMALHTQLEQTRAGLPLLRKQLEQNEHLLATLSGQAPGDAQVPDFTLAEFKLPADLPLVMPSELVRRRPDIQAAEALLHAANAEYGVAVAKLYPQINLSASLGSQALTTGALFGGSSAVWNLLGQLIQPLFNPGLPAEKRSSLAALDAAAANYQGVVLDALRNVADTLRALEHDAQALESLAVADSASRSFLESVERQYTIGAASYTQLLIAGQQDQQNKIGWIAAQAQRLADTVSLYQALGGGYEVSDKPGPM